MPSSDCYRARFVLRMKPDVIVNLVKCDLVHFDIEHGRFYVQDDADTAKKIEQLVLEEDKAASALSSEALQSLPANSKLIVTYDAAPFRAVIQSNQADEQVTVYYVDFGNTGSCLKSELKQCSEQLSSLPNQAKECRLHGVAAPDLDKALTYLSEHSDAESIAISIVNEKNGVLDVLIFLDGTCINEQFGYDQSTIVTATKHDAPTTASDQEVKHEESLACEDSAERSTDELSVPETEGR